MAYQKPTLRACNLTAEQACCCGMARLIFAGGGVVVNNDGSVTAWYDVGSGPGAQYHCECPS